MSCFLGDCLLLALCMSNDDMVGSMSSSHYEDQHAFHAVIGASLFDYAYVCGCAGGLWDCPAIMSGVPIPLLECMDGSVSQIRPANGIGI